MGTNKQRSENAFVLWFHAGFFLIAAVALSPCLIGLVSATTPPGDEFQQEPCSDMGRCISALVVGWNVAFAFSTFRFGFYQLFEYWRFVAMLSVLMVIPDFFLVDGMGTLHFPSDGAWQIGGAVSCYMAGMWSIPLLWILFVCPGSGEPCVQELFRAAGVALAVFGSAEHVLFPLNLWHATEKVHHMIGHTAIYVMLAEAMLGSTVLFAYRATQNRGWLSQLVGCTITMLVYTGALAVSFLFVEGSSLISSS
mmetsp:Transcript_25392/g.45988  ORF Transcript_25392/g.45988 Transcript_25392/m.45988 type:complete len:252 (+) Transcript_25392:135-890(+)